MRRALAALAALLVLIALLALGVGVAPGERIQQGNLLASLHGGVSPLKLPRHRPAPVAIHLSGTLATTDGSVLPQVNTMEFALAGRSGINTHGLPVCPVRILRHTRDRQALADCGDALVGRGSVEAQVLIPEQPPLQVKAHLLIFNGRAKGGGTRLLLHAYAESPPIAVILPFTLRHPHGQYGNVLVARDLGRMPTVISFAMTLSRRFSYRGDQRSFLVASCPLPRRFSSGLLSLARLELKLDGGRHIATEIVRTCRAPKPSPKR